METKQCTICGLIKPIKEFAFRDKKNKIYRTDCKKCHSSKVLQHYQNNKDLLNQTKVGKCCEKCGYSKCLEALDYHHKDPSNKLNTISRLATHSSIEMAMKEIEKCILLCANCHREFHYLEKATGITLEEFLK